MPKQDTHRRGSKDTTDIRLLTLEAVILGSQGAFKDTQEVERVLNAFLGDSYMETAVLNGVPAEASTRAFPVYAARAIWPETRNDPSRQYELISDDDRTSHIGIRLTYGLSRKIDYVSHLDLNNLTIRV